ncbi:MAG: hypothetical protein NTY33_03985 [Candidatus Moranbacteria bacterium]|nr:hypothetical protein [Candidatus Moranbacteria bacterium]
MNQKHKPGAIFFWPVYSIFCLMTDIEFWLKETECKRKEIEPEFSRLNMVPLILLGSISSMKSPHLTIHLKQKIRHDKMFVLAKVSDLMFFGTTEDLIKFCRCAIHFSGRADMKHLDSIENEARILAGEMPSAGKELIDFFARAVTRDEPAKA